MFTYISRFCENPHRINGLNQKRSGMDVRRLVIWILVIMIMLMCVSEAKRKNKEKSKKSKSRSRPGSRLGARLRARKLKSMDPDVFLERFGYLKRAPQGVQHSPVSRREAIKNFQRMTGLGVSGRLDKITRKKMASPRCGMPDMVPPDTNLPPPGVAMEPGQHPQNFYVPGYKWNKLDLTWRAHDFTRDLPSSSQLQAFRNAFQYWMDVSPIDVREIRSGTPDIYVSFGVRDHGDGVANSFDGEGGTLAHAYYPEDGTTHFDDEETWTENTDRGTNLQIVAAHEFGHALGLGHSNIPEALMAPFYQGYDADFRLHDDDVWGIQTLYGGPVRPETPRPGTTTTRAPDTNPDRDTCSTKFGAVLQAHDSRIYVFSSKYLWRMNDYGVDDGFPKRLTKIYPDAPYNMGAAVYSWRTRYTYFFKGRKVWKFYGFTKIQKKTVDSSDYPSSVQAAFIGRDGLIYLFKGSEYWVFDEASLDVRPGRGRPVSQQWPGIPPNIESAVRLRDGYTYFFKGSRYRKYDEYYHRVLPGYPKDKARPWMGEPCGGYQPK